MKTLQQSADDDQPEHETKISISYPDEIVEEILSRLPVKPILQFRSVSKPWRSLISTPSFSKLHFTRSRYRTAFFISACDPSTRERYFLSAPCDGGPATHLVTLKNVSDYDGYAPYAEHFNGLICFSFRNGSLFPNCAFVMNPGTHSIFKVPDSVSHCDDGVWFTSYMFGFDESTYEHKILHIKIKPPNNRATSVKTLVSIFSMSNYSWRKINAKLPIKFSRGCRISCSLRCSVCVGSVIHFMFTSPGEMFMFDLRTEKFSKIKTLFDDFTSHSFHIIRKINGYVGISCFEDGNMLMWLLQDYESCVWVRETIEVHIPTDRYTGSCMFDSDSLNVNEIIVVSYRWTWNVIVVLIYNLKSRCFRKAHLTMDQPFLCSDTVEFNLIKCYAESIVPLEGNITWRA